MIYSYSPKDEGHVERENEVEIEHPGDTFDAIEMNSQYYEDRNDVTLDHS